MDSLDDQLVLEVCRGADHTDLLMSTQAQH